ncbi:peptidylprolyl isomerase, partial [Mycobacterium tuberculosis]|nr:peptidylprolyl isomerase [Mycobacterium tuberculosis]
RGTAEIVVTTGSGEIPLTLDREGAPCNVASFVHLAEQEYFDDTECHRLTQGGEGSQLSVLQCGDPTGTGLSGPGYSIVDEPPTDLKPAGGTNPMAGQQSVIYPRGTIAIANSNQGGQSSNTGSSQF